METTFITIHNLTPEANIIFASDSITDILGYHPDEVTGRSCFDYFHADEVPFARQVHSRGVRLEKAAVLHYARIRGRDGRWVGCECVFTVTYDVLVACTSVYRADVKSERRAVEAPAIRRLFSASPRDPRYHMLEHLSSKFRAEPVQREPRAAIILNRFTRTLTVMYATDSVEGILGVTADQFKGKSFYECIQENCLPEAIRCLESAKANDSIAYLRFWYRDPRRAEDFDEEMREDSTSSDSDDGGVDLQGAMDVDGVPVIKTSLSAAPEGSSVLQIDEMLLDNTRFCSPSSQASRRQNNHTSSGESTTDLEQDNSNAIFDHQYTLRSSTSSLLSSEFRPKTLERGTPAPLIEPFEIEAVVSCTSDGLVVALRRAKPIPPNIHAIRARAPAPVPVYPHGLFAAPWGAYPIRPHQFQPNDKYPFPRDFEASIIPVGGLPVDDFLNSIREVAVFAWSLAGINGNIASYGHGVPFGEAQPPGGLPVWEPQAQPASNSLPLPPINQAERRWLQRDQTNLMNQRGQVNQIHERTNTPINKNPFVHAHQEQLLREHLGVASGPMGSDQPGPSSSMQVPSYHRYVGGFGDYVFQGPGNYQNNQYESFFGRVQKASPGLLGPLAENIQTPNFQPQYPGKVPSEGSRGC